MSTGAIGRLVRDRGFGFIKAGAGIDLFFHRNEVEDVPFNILKEGQTVEFRISLSPGGLKAVNAKLTKKKTESVSVYTNKTDF